MTRRLVLTYLSLVLAVLTGLAVPLGYLYQRSEQQQAFRQLEREAEIVAAYVDAELGEDDGDQVEDIATAAARRWGGQVELFDVTGRLLYSTMPQVTDTADVIPALGEGGRIGHRVTDIDGVRMMSVSVSFHAGKPTSGAVRLSVPMAPVTEQIRRVWAMLTAICLLVLAASGAVALALARWIVRPVKTLEQATQQLADDAGPVPVRLTGGPPELRRLAETFNRTAERLHGALAARGAFADHASHQLKGPLAALRLRLENLETEVSAAGAAGLQAAVSETERLDKLVNALLDLTMIERTDEVPVRVDAATEAMRRAEIWRPLAAERGITVAAEAVGPLWATAMPGAIEQVLDNLISNALNAAPDRSTIRLTARPTADGLVAVHVIDAGPGLPGDHREKALEPFWRAPGAPRGGTGLGLALVAKLVQAGGGHVRLDPAEPTGIDAVVTLPAATPPSPARPRVLSADGSE
ncbi:HAMP domain-containing histidine kinase [Actinoplanes sp. LDG1-06]|uniref:histidine kinase n=1 Tax=Paractinoplanes ovalisporus TaxID=2810368 RepID=A0ABS2AUP0_9ACTN|nr:HAMP domain-containing sensor histidine kinase [Actinoplanes ovalisporus]MBM2623593.1 HAMP domain-containing histidine kinase [Actinoplanes ovalisporus]